MLKAMMDVGESNRANVSQRLSTMLRMRHSVRSREIIGKRRTALLSEMLRKGGVLSFLAPSETIMTNAAAVWPTGERICVTRKLRAGEGEGEAGFQFQFFSPSRSICIWRHRCQK